MRVTDSQIFEIANLRMQKARSDDATAADQVSTSKRIQHVWDAAGDAGMIARHEQEVGRQTAIMTATSKAGNELGAVDTAMGQVIDSLTRAREIATQLSNDTYSATDRANAAAEVQQIFSTMISQMNTRFGDRYVFGGTRDATPAFDSTGAYLGDAGVRQVEVAPGILQDASIRGDEVFKGASGGIDVLAEIQALSTALTTNNVAAVRASVEQMATGVTQVSTYRSRSGGMMNVFDVASNTARVNRDLATDSKAGLEDVDVFEAATNYSAAERALEATMAAVARSFKLTLLDKL